ncbi:DEAD/DEAH box helicase [Magnetofaba australis]|uniref:Putative SNF2-related protein n=1 Tax=Magnetofaba australis IT-1 TaxID=1434232 RepID=A0A1Y2KCL9_9PROT|nr:DEAD/DEAH box helicase [Magnetofaba australis]OSM08774.1 putative SNF2-related protein [Magnetofaba australis IT-1]
MAKSPNKAELLREYRSLAPLPQTALQLVALYHEPISRGKLGKLLLALGAITVTAHANTAAVGRLMDPLEIQELVHAFDEHNGIYYRCARAIEWEVVRDIQARGLLAQMRQAIAQHVPSIPPWHLNFGRVGYLTHGRLVRELRCAILSGEAESLPCILETIVREYPQQWLAENPMLPIFAEPFDAPWFGALDPTIQFTALRHLFQIRLEAFADLTPLAAILDALIAQNSAAALPVHRHWLTVLALLSNQLDLAEALLTGDVEVEASHCLHGWWLTLCGEHDAAIRQFDKALTVIRKESRQQKVFLNHPSGIFTILALLHSGKPEHLKKAERHLNWLHGREGFAHGEIYDLLRIPLLLLTHQNTMATRLTLNRYAEYSGMAAHDARTLETFLQNLEALDQIALPEYFVLLGLHWLAPEAVALNQDYIEAFCAHATAHGYGLFSDALAVLAPGVDTEPSVWNPVALIEHKAPWEYALERLESEFLSAADPPRAVTPASADERLAWVIDPDAYTQAGFVVQPKLQKRTAKGGWSKGRDVALKRLFTESEQMPWLTSQDHKACAAIRSRQDYWGSRYDLDDARALTELAGHPLVFWAERMARPIEVMRREPRLIARRDGERVRLQFPHEAAANSVRIVEQTPERCVFIRYEAAHQRLAETLGEEGLRVPAEALDRVQRLLGPLAAQVEIETDLEIDNAQLPHVEPNAQPVIHLLPDGDGLWVKLLVQPLGESGPSLEPGEGTTTLIAAVDGKRQQTRRDLDAERGAAQAIMARCPALAGDGWQWRLDDPAHCLELLLQLRELGDDARVLWPQGESLRVGEPVAMDKLFLTTEGDADWFSLDGQLRLPEGDVLEMKALLAALTPQSGRFIELGEGRYLALTRQFEQQLRGLATLAEKRGRGERFHHLMLPTLQEITEQAGGVETHDGWRERAAQIERIQTTEPALPRTFEAELRPYQEVGFQWLARLAEWGAGACLADDMGLGKTLQILALLTARAPDGPALVAAPTSVCGNWLSEAARFAPTLNMIPFGPGDRAQTVAQLGPFDVLVCPFALLQGEAEKLQSVHWRSVALDEAQAIKNPATKRAKAAYGLNADCRVVATGTPIENHLGELWSLFRFLNPGLLGARESFAKRFAAPIDRGDADARAALQRVLKPFILRRTKNQVLDDLPPKTEITLRVEPTPQEAALYEALRQQAIENLSAVDGENPQDHVNVLAQITRLRRACCHPELVAPGQGVGGAKLEQFAEIVAELRDNGHRALVFSQFVDHLAIVRQWLDGQKIPYQYLDGATPAKQRQKRVAAFQQGAGDLFLISLKAGGFGLNLTGADYVIHLDPWWNPAVEDQASDRAHRIGQTRPVTIYRLVMAGAIEEKIIDLHHRKRKLADELLDGTHQAEKLTTEMLLQLIRA